MLAERGDLRRQNSRIGVTSVMPHVVVSRGNAISSNPRADAAMDRYSAGDDLAFNELYDALVPRMYGFILRKVHNNVARAEDLVQQAMLQLHCARGRYVAGSWVTPWAFAILRRLYLDQERRKKLELLSRDGCPPTDFAAPGQDPEQLASDRQQLELLVDSVLSTLSSAQRAAFEVVYYGQMSHAEAAATLGTSVASVKLRVQRANQAIRTALQAANARGVKEG